MSHDARPRKLSFNPVGTWVPQIAHEEPRVGAPEVAKTKRILQIGVAVIYCLSAAGIVFGFAAVKPVLIAEGVYKEQCTKKELDQDVWVCSGQELRLNFMFTVAAVSTNVVALPVGTILDQYGPRVCGLISVIFVTLGCLFFAFASQLPFDGYVPAYFCLALGGPFLFISSFHLSNAFPQYSGLILALLTGAFDTSSAVFFVYRLIYQASDGKIGLKKFFLFYLIIPALILLIELCLMPADSYKTIEELVTVAKDDTCGVQDTDLANGNSAEAHRIREQRRTRSESIISEAASLLSDTKTKQTDRKADQRARSGVWGAMHGKSAYKQIISPWWILIALFTVVQMTRINYFVATIRSQYDYLLRDYDKAVQINEFFDMALPLGGVIAVPIIGLVLDNTSTPFVLALLVTVATTIGVLGVIPQMWAAYANVCLFVLYRPLYYTTVSDYAGKVFGYETFGKVYGLIICLAGLLNFSQSGLDALTHKVFDGNPIPANIILLVVTFVIGVALVGYVWQKSRIMARQRLEDEAEGATEQLVPGAAQETVEDHHHPVDVHGDPG